MAIEKKSGFQLSEKGRGVGTQGMRRDNGKKSKRNKKVGDGKGRVGLFFDR